MLQATLEQITIRALDHHGLTDFFEGQTELTFEQPADQAHGDYSTNAALILFGKLAAEDKQRLQLNSPRELAQTIVNQINQDPEKPDFIEKLEVAGPGFINFHISNQPYFAYLNQLVQQKKSPFSKSQKLDQSIVVEYSSPNIAKPFTIGHLRSTIIGDAVANLLEARGYHVYRDNHLGDWGTQFGKQICAIKKWGDEKVISQAENKVKELVSLYVKFHQEAENDESLIKEGRLWFKKLEEGDQEAKRLWQQCVDWSLSEFKKIYQKLGIEFTENQGLGYGESFFQDKMDQVISELREKELLTKSDGAELVFFPDEEYPPLMILKADGATLYSTRDLATDKFRLEKYGQDVRIINEVGAEQALYFKQLFRVEEMLGWVKSEQRVHLKHGLYRFKDKKMSTRKGNVIWLNDVLNESFQRVAEIAGDRIDQEAIWQIAIGALKWNDLKRRPELNVVFDWDEIIRLEGNSGPYVQYTYTRAISVLQRANRNGNQSNRTEMAWTEFEQDLSNDLEEVEEQLLKKFYQFADVLEQAEQDLSLHHLTNYLFELSQLFNSFYNQLSILDAQTKKHKQFRLALTEATAYLIKQGLDILGIETLKKM
ncbi:MAG: arginine--tRNA ligase [Candidatus Pacebacteria bacterium]|nr:arginine--tRNA ligase [Candidatus Paceibacterota bacterium]